MRDTTPAHPRGDVPSGAGRAVSGAGTSTRPGSPTTSSARALPTHPTAGPACPQPRFGRADDLQIAGMVPLSTVDWPGRLAAVLFLQGCPWDCGYCQNASLRACDLPGLVDWRSEVVPLLERRRGLLDGIVFSGGEATRQLELVPAMTEARELGFEIGLHTAGAYPARLLTALPLVDWVGLDIKALPEDYGAAVGVAAGGDKAWKSLGLVLDAVDARRGTLRPLGLEVRLTVHPGSPQADRAVEIAQRLRELGVEHLALQNARTEGTRLAFQQRAAGWDQAAWRERFEEISRAAERLDFASFEAR